MKKYALSIAAALALLIAPNITLAQADQPPDCPMVASVAGGIDHPFPIFAQRPGGDGPGGGPGWSDRMGKRKHLEQLRMLKLLEFLDLSEDQEIEFLTRFKAMRFQEQEIETNRRAKAEQLAAAIENEQTSDTEINTLVDELQAIMQGKKAIFDSFMVELKPILTSRQRAKMMIFEDRFEVELLKRVNEFQKRRLNADESRLEPPMDTDK